VSISSLNNNNINLNLNTNENVSDTTSNSVLTQTREVQKLEETKPTGPSLTSYENTSKINMMTTLKGKLEEEIKLVLPGNNVEQNEIHTNEIHTNEIHTNAQEGLSFILPSTKSNSINGMLLNSINSMLPNSIHEY
jgi:hypothetical protein